MPTATARGTIVSLHAAVGSAGRAAGSTCHHPRTLAAPAISVYSSYCFSCASWYFARDEQRCNKCGDRIFRWVRNDELKLFHSRSSLGGF